MNQEKTETQPNNSHAAHPFQPIIDELKTANIRITSSESAYKLLYKLCKHKSIRMNGSALKAAQHGGLPKKKIISQARALLREYIKTGLVVLPAHMTVKGSDHKYQHDGDAAANRNMWRTGWRSPSPKDKTYGGLNTTKG